MLASVLHINIFGDERDEVLKKWNMLQACWGTGKGYYRPQDPPVEYDFTSSFYRFRAMGYVVFPQPENSDGFVKLTFKKKDSELKYDHAHTMHVSINRFDLSSRFRSDRVVRSYKNSCFFLIFSRGIVQCDLFV